MRNKAIFFIQMFSNYVVATLSPVEKDVKAHGKEESQFLRQLPYKSEWFLKCCMKVYKNYISVKTIHMPIREGTLAQKEKNEITRKRKSLKLSMFV